MRTHKTARKRSAWYDDHEAFFYNPFRRFSKRIKTSSADGNDDKQYQANRENLSPRILAEESTPRVYGDLFSTSETFPEPAVNYESLASRPVIGTSGIDQPIRHALEKQASIPLVEAGLHSLPSSHRLILRIWHRLSVRPNYVRNDESSLEDSHQARRERRHIRLRK